MKAISGADATRLALIAASSTPQAADALSRGLSTEAKKIAKAVVAPTRHASRPVKETAKAIRSWAAAK